MGNHRWTLLLCRARTFAEMPSALLPLRESRITLRWKLESQITSGPIKELCGLLPEMASATKRIDKGLILKALGERSARFINTSVARFGRKSVSKSVMSSWTFETQSECRSEYDLYIGQILRGAIKTSLDAAAINVMRPKKNKKGKKAIQNTQASPQRPDE